MDTTQKRMVAKDSGRLQIPYAEYTELMEKMKLAQRLQEARDVVLAELKSFEGVDVQSGLDAVPSMEEVARRSPKATKKSPAPAAAPVAEKKVKEVVKEKPAPAPKAEPVVSQPKDEAGEPVVAEGLDVPPIKKDIALHFNKLDESGRLFNVFKQYYVFLNNSCGGTVRVTMKDGFCSLWNYDEWEEFAFVDVFEEKLRVALSPRYTDKLESLSFCDVPRLLSSRMELVCVQVDGLNNTMLDVLTVAFKEVGMAAS